MFTTKNQDMVMSCYKIEKLICFIEIYSAMSRREDDPEQY